MSISLTFETKPSTTSLSFEDKGHSETWNDATYTWDEAYGTWAVPGTVLIEESKNNISLSFEAKT